MEREKFSYKELREVKKEYNEPKLIKMGQIIRDTKGNQGSIADTGGNPNNINQNQPA